MRAGSDTFTSATDFVAAAAFICGPSFGPFIVAAMVLACAITAYQTRQLWPLLAVAELAAIVVASGWAYWAAFWMSWDYLDDPSPTSPPWWLSALDTATTTVCDLSVLGATAVAVIAWRRAPASRF